MICEDCAAAGAPKRGHEACLLELVATGYTPEGSWERTTVERSKKPKRAPKTRRERIAAGLQKR